MDNWPADGGGNLFPDANGNTDCTDYEADRDLCGVYDTDSVDANGVCCICGGGLPSNEDPASIMVDSDVADLNAMTNLGTGEFQLRDQDLYVIYPTTEKALFDNLSLRRANDEWPISGNNTKSRKNECTKILGL